MAHFALISPPFYSHLRVFEALADALVARGHRCTFVLNEGGEALVPGRAVRTVAGGGMELGTIVERAARPSGPLGILRTVADTARLTQSLCAGAPALMFEIGADAVIGDQMEPACGLVACHLGLPFVSLACALPINAAPGVPPPFLDWPYDLSPAGLKRNRGGERVARLLLTRQRRTIELAADRLGLLPRQTLEDCLSPDLQISQTPAGFDFPRPPASHLHAVGPIRRKRGADEPLPFDIDPARPLVFASLGTLQGHRLSLFRNVARACRRLGAQSLIAHCGRLNAAQAASIGADFVTDFAPQAAVMARADACVTHGGLNTVLDALSAGVPLLCIPIAFDQPGVAARIVHHGVGLKCGRLGATGCRIEARLGKLLSHSSYRERAAALAAGFDSALGADVAVSLIEKMMGERPGAASLHEERRGCRDLERPCGVEKAS